MKKSKKGKKHTAIKLLGILMIAVSAVLLTVYGMVHSLLGKIDYQNIDSSMDMPKIQDEEPYEELEWMEEESEEDIYTDIDEQEIAGAEEILFSENVFNILLIGSDGRKKDGGGRSDTNILVSINSSTKEITMTSLMRDSYVAIPGHENNRINAAYAYGGAKLLLKTIKTNFGVQVEKFAAVDFYAFIDIIDMIGGVDIEISDAEAEMMNQYIWEVNRSEELDQLEGGGTTHLNGTQALAYVRLRKVGNADFERTQRQRTVLAKIFEKVKKMNLLQLNELLRTLLPEIKTNMSEKEILNFLMKAPEYLQYDLKTLRIPADGTYESRRIRGMAVLEVDLDKNREILAQEIYGMKDGRK